MPPTGPLATALAAGLARARVDAQRLAAERTALDALRAERDGLDRARTEWARTSGVAGVAAGQPPDATDPSRPLGAWKDVEVLRQRFEAVAERLGRLEALYQRVEHVPTRPSGSPDFAEFREEYGLERSLALSSLACLDASALEENAKGLDRVARIWDETTRALIAETSAATARFRALDGALATAAAALQRLERPPSPWKGALGDLGAHSVYLGLGLGVVGCCGGLLDDAAETGCAGGTTIGVILAFFLTAALAARGDERRLKAAGLREELEEIRTGARRLQVAVKELVERMDAARLQAPEHDRTLRLVGDSGFDMEARVDQALAVTPRANPVPLVFGGAGMVLLLLAAGYLFVEQTPAIAFTRTAPRAQARTQPREAVAAPSEEPSSSPPPRSPDTPTPPETTAAPKPSDAVTAEEPTGPSAEPVVADSDPPSAPATTPAGSPDIPPTAVGTTEPLPLLAAGTWIGTVDDHPLRLVVPDGGTRLTLKVVEGDKITECKVAVSGSGRQVKLTVSGCDWSSEVNGAVTGDGAYTGLGTAAKTPNRLSTWSLRHVQ